MLIEPSKKFFELYDKYVEKYDSTFGTWDINTKAMERKAIEEMEKALVGARGEITEEELGITDVEGSDK